MTIKPQLYPPGGYNFRESDGSVHSGNSWAHLVRVVAQYRAVRRLPPGNPAKEITEAVCQANPQLCHNGPGELGGGDMEAYYIRVAEWLARVMQKVRHASVRFVDAIKARERAEICRGCPYQKQWMKNCVSCQKSADASQKHILRGRPDAGRGLLGCEILSEDTAVSVHLDDAPKGDPRLPGHCWRKRK